MLDLLRNNDKKFEEEDLQDPDETTNLLDKTDEIASKGTYVLTLNGTPQFYLSNYEDAIEEMWSLARKIQFENHSYNCLIHNPVDGFPDKIHIIGRYTLFLVYYDKLLHELEIHKVKEIPFNETLSK